MSRSTRGFTLVEILVVIAVIAILAAIIFPVFSSAREKGRQTSCLSNLRQLGSAMRMYADDWDGVLPLARVQEGGDGNPYGNWAGVYQVFGKCDPSKGQLFAYCKSTSIYLCPSARGIVPVRITAPDAKPYPLSYSMNNWLSGREIDRVTTSSSQVGMLVHEDASTLDDGDFYWAGWAYGTEGYNEPARIHNGGTCVLYCDLHSKWQSYDAVISALRRDEWNPWR